MAKTSTPTQSINTHRGGTQKWWAGLPQWVKNILIGAGIVSVEGSIARTANQCYTDAMKVTGIDHTGALEKTRKEPGHKIQHKSTSTQSGRKPVGTRRRSPSTAAPTAKRRSPSETEFDQIITRIKNDPKKIRGQSLMKLKMWAKKNPKQAAAAAAILVAVSGAAFAKTRKKLLADKQHDNMYGNVKPLTLPPAWCQEASQEH